MPNKYLGMHARRRHFRSAAYHLVLSCDLILQALCLHVGHSATATAVLAKPTTQQLEWQDMEIGALTFNIGMYQELMGGYNCGNDQVPVPPASSFSPTDLNVTDWFASITACGARYAVLTVQADCGFVLYPSNVSFPWGGRYNYTVRESPFKRDLLREFVDGARAAGVRPGVYYIVNSNALLSRVYNATPAQTRSVILGQLREIWSNYGELVELWFDGGTHDPELGPHISALLKDLQPNAVCFQGPTTIQGVRWAGTESGHVTLPNWSAASASTDFGSGAVHGAEFAPTEADVTLSSDGKWRWSPGQPIKSLAYLTALYDASVGHNANLLLNFSPTYTGLFPPEAVTRYAQFGQWQRQCYGEENKLNETVPGGQDWSLPSVGRARPQKGAPIAVGMPLVLTLVAPGVGTGARVVLMEDQTLGQRIVNYTLEGCTAAAHDEHVNATSWVEIMRGQSIGHKRIIALPNCTTRMDFRQLRVTVLEVATNSEDEIVEQASLRSFAAYGATKCAVPPSPPHAPCSLEEHYAFKGKELQPIGRQVSSVADCCSACRTVAGKACVAFTYGKNDSSTESEGTSSRGGHCRLFSALSGGGRSTASESGSPIY